MFFFSFCFLLSLSLGSAEENLLVSLSLLTWGAAHVKHSTSSLFPPKKFLRFLVLHSRTLVLAKEGKSKLIHFFIKAESLSPSCICVWVCAWVREGREIRIRWNYCRCMLFPICSFPPPSTRKKYGYLCTTSWRWATISGKTCVYVSNLGEKKGGKSLFFFPQRKRKGRTMVPCLLNWCPPPFHF